VQKAAAARLLGEGRAALQRQDLDGAITALGEASRKDPECVEAYYLRGVAYGRKGDQVRARADREESVRLNPALANDPPR